MSCRERKQRPSGQYKRAAYVHGAAFLYMYVCIMQLDKFLKNVHANGQWNTTVEVIDIWIIRITKISAAAGIY